MIVKIYPQNPNETAVARVVDILRRDGVIIYPTDSVYAFGCSLQSHKAMERLRALKGKKATDMAIICCDLSNIADYARVDTPTFKLLKRNLPGPFTFVLQASKRIPDKLLGNRRTIGVRIPDNSIPVEIVRALGHPLITTSVRDDDEVVEYTTDPELIEERYGKLVDLVVDGGYGKNEPTTVVDCSGEEPSVIREGIGELIF